MNLFIKLTALSVIFLFLGCNDDESEEIVQREYGVEGNHEIASFTADDYDYSTIYYPKDIATMDHKSPLVFFASGWFGSPKRSTTYETLITFITSHGYTVVYTDEGSVTDPMHSINGYNNLLEKEYVKDNILKYVDTDKVGVVGHSAGGGIIFKILDYYTKEKEYGKNGRFLMGLDPWYAFGMSKAALENLPSNTNLVFIKFGEGGNNKEDGTDPRIPLTEYSLLKSIDATKKDYQVYDKENANHDYPTGSRSYTQMQGILRPLDALLDYTFVNQSEAIRKIALENGNDDPYADGKGIQVILDSYKYPCDGARTLIDYCAIVP